MSECTVNSLTIYPMKGCQGVEVESIELRKGGIVGDRELMLVRDGNDYAQRDHPQMAKVGVAILDNGRIKLTDPDAGEFVHAITAQGDDLPAMCTYNEFPTVDQGDEIAAWFCEAMGDEGIRVVSMPNVHTRRFPLPKFMPIHEQPQTQMFDVAPVLVNNQASLDDLNSRTSHHVPMDRFRCNIVIDGLEAFEEDNITSLYSDSVELLYLDVCERCIMTTTDQKTGERPHKDPINTLAKYRKREEHAYASGLAFGAYMAITKEGTLSVGEALRINL